MLWISLSSLDQVTHNFGPQSKETIDTIYHLDNYIKSFMDNASQLVSPEKTLYVLTADHGFMRLPEFRDPPQKSFLASDIKEKINSKLAQKYLSKNLIQAVKTPFIYINQKYFQNFSQEQQQNIKKDIKRELENHPAVSTRLRDPNIIQDNLSPIIQKMAFEKSYLPTSLRRFNF